MLLDDELPGLAYLKMLCQRIPELDVLKAFNNPEVFLRESATIEHDLCIMDIEMPGINGLQLAELLGGKPVIFTTAYKEYAAEAFDLNAVDYVRKPVKLERLRQAVLKAMERIDRKTPVADLIQVNTAQGRTMLSPDELIRVHTSDLDSRDKVAHLADGTQLLLKNIGFGPLLQMLPAEAFCRVNKREIVAIKRIRSFDHETVTLTVADPSGRPIVLGLGEVYKEEIYRRLKR